MLKEETLSAMYNAIKAIVMDEANIIKYLDLYNFDIKTYETMDEYILDNYNYELFGKQLHWTQLESVGSRTIQYFIPYITIISHNYNIYYEVINWIQNQDYYKLMSLYALSISYDIISAHIASIKMIWFNNDKTTDDVNV
jgi:hypothetical protein